MIFSIALFRKFTNVGMVGDGASGIYDMKITHETAAANILLHATERRFEQSEWQGLSRDGRATACLLGAIDPDINSEEQCNGDLMPMWLAVLTTTLFDSIPIGEIYVIGERYGHLIARWGVVSPRMWDSVLDKFVARLSGDVHAASQRACPGAAACARIAIHAISYHIGEAGRHNPFGLRWAVASTARAARYGEWEGVDTYHLQLFNFLLDTIEDAVVAAESI